MKDRVIAQRLMCAGVVLVSAGMLEISMAMEQPWARQLFILIGVGIQSAWLFRRTEQLNFMRAYLGQCLVRHRKQLDQLDERLSLLDTDGK